MKHEKEETGFLHEPQAKARSRPGGSAQLLLHAFADRKEAMTGYSGTPLVQKLGIRSGERILALAAPAVYADWLTGLPPGVTITAHGRGKLDFVHLFATRRTQLQKQIVRVRPRLSDTAIFWVSWPKKSARVATDVTEDVIREIALPLGLVDTKVCAVDEVWSGLKLMIRRQEKGRRPNE